MNNSNIVIEYQIEITNKSKIDGYVRKIYEYIPEGFSLYEEQTGEWYQKNGIYITEKLANEKISEGETKTITLTLIGRSNQEFAGTYKNQAEIGEAYNSQGIEDINSVPGNKNINENDIDSADVIISIRTGKVYMYIILVTTIILIIGIGIYLIKKKVIY